MTTQQLLQAALQGARIATQTGNRRSGQLLFGQLGHLARHRQRAIQSQRQLAQLPGEIRRRRVIGEQHQQLRLLAGDVFLQGAQTSVS